MAGSHPLLDINTAWTNFNLLEIFRLRTALNTVLLQVTFKMFE